jgi:hypothetical protein
MAIYIAGYEFAEMLQDAGMLDDIEKVTNITINCAPDEVVTMGITRLIDREEVLELIRLIKAEEPPKD